MPAPVDNNESIEDVTDFEMVEDSSEYTIVQDKGDTAVYTPSSLTFPPQKFILNITADCGVCYV